MSKPPKMNFKALIANDVAPNKTIGEEAAAADMSPQEAVAPEPTPELAPAAPAGTRAALATTCPFQELSVETKG